MAGGSARSTRPVVLAHVPIHEVGVTPSGEPIIGSGCDTALLALRR